MALSSLILLPFAMYFGEPFSASLTEIIIMALFGLIFAIASITLVLGSRYLPSSETALISSVEAPFAIFLAWLIFSEVPVMTTAIGGMIILCVVIGSQALANRQ